jgi:hypothetical protein
MMVCAHFFPVMLVNIRLCMWPDVMSVVLQKEAGVVFSVLINL